jgi:hypothetical protein
VATTTTTITPTLTAAGREAAFNASLTGIAVEITKISFGGGTYAPTGSETAMNDQYAIVTIAGGSSISSTQIRITAVWADAELTADITEVGIWAGDVLFAVWSTKAGTAIASKTPGTDFVLFCDMVFDQVPADSITVVIDPESSAVLSALVTHENDPNAHEQYQLIENLAQVAGSLVWCGTAGGTADALLLSLPDASTLTGYEAGQAFSFIAASNNDGAMTVNVEGLGVVAITKAGTTVMVADDIVAGALYEIVFDGTQFQIRSCLAAGRTFETYTYTATAAQVLFNLSYTADLLQVIVNGKTLPPTGFTANDGATVTLATASTAGDIVQFVVWNVFQVADTYTKTKADATFAPLVDPLFTKTVTVTGATALKSTLAVTGAATLSSTLAVTGAATLSSTLGVTGAATLSSTLAVTGAATLTGAVLAKSTLGVTGATTLSSTLAVTGAATLSSTLAVTGTATLNGAAVLKGTLALTGAATLSSTLAVTGATTLSSTLGVTGASTLSGALEVAGAATMDTTLGVTGAATLSSTLAVAGATTLTGAATLKSTLGVTGAATISSTLGVTGATTLASTLSVAGESVSTSANAWRIVSGNYGTFWRNDGANLYLMLTASGDTSGTWTDSRPFTVNLATGGVTLGGAVSASGTLGVVGAATLSSTLAVTGATTLSSTLAVTGATTLSSTLGVTGAATLSSTLAVTGATTLTGAASLKSTLAVTGAATLSSTLGVTGAATLSSTLGVTGAATLSSTLAVTGATTLTGAASLKSTLAVTGAATLASTLAVTGLTALNGGCTVTSSGSVSGLTVLDTGANGANIMLAGNGTTTPNKYLRSDAGNLDIVNSAYSAVIASLSDVGAFTANGNITSNADIHAAGNLYASGAFLDTSGNAYGTTWGGYLSTWISARLPTGYVTTAGYWRCQNTGFMIQWGLASSVATEGTTTVYFTTAFPSACVGGFANSVYSAHISGGTNACYFYPASTSAAYVTNDGTSGTATPVFWMALGY